MTLFSSLAYEEGCGGSAVDQSSHSCSRAGQRLLVALGVLREVGVPPWSVSPREVGVPGPSAAAGRVGPGRAVRGSGAELRLRRPRGSRRELRASNPPVLREPREGAAAKQEGGNTSPAGLGCDSRGSSDNNCANSDNCGGC